MRKYTLIIITAMILGVAMLAAGAARAADEVETVKVSGKVEYKAAAATAWSPLKKGMRLSQGATVRTGKDGTTVLRWFAGNSVKISPMSVLKIDIVSSVGGTENTALAMDEGRAHLKAKKLKASSTYIIKTPTAHAGVRGTEFVAEHSAGGQSTFTVLEGSILVEAIEVSRIIEAEHYVTVDMGKAPVEPMEVPDDTLDSLQQESEEIDSVLEAVDDAGAAVPDDVLDTIEESAETVVEDTLQQDMDNLIMENIITPANDCCSY